MKVESVITGAEKEAKVSLYMYKCVHATRRAMSWLSSITYRTPDYLDVCPKNHFCMGFRSETKTAAHTRVHEARDCPFLNSRIWMAKSSYYMICKLFMCETHKIKWNKLYNIYIAASVGATYSEQYHHHHAILYPFMAERDLRKLKIVTYVFPFSLICFLPVVVLDTVLVHFSSSVIKCVTAAKFIYLRS